jgi:pSer/pThr/pTyr-binding forkhead associated (FHA) protein
MLAKLLVVRGQPQGKLLVFPSGEYVIGRGDECHIRPNSSWVSRQHCILNVSEESVTLKDLGSTNGTLVNGRRVMGERQLSDGDHVQIGPLVFKLSVALVDVREAAQNDTALHCLETAESEALARTTKDEPTLNDVDLSAHLPAVRR